MVDLNLFCGEEGDKRLGKPWSSGDFTMATNGHILIRVPRQEGVDDNEFAPNIERNSLKKAFSSEPEAWVTPPAVIVSPQPCPQCNGTGKACICPECDGEGEVVAETDYNEYEVTCKTCDGDGQFSGTSSEKMTRCLKCSGHGDLWEDKSVEINGVLLSDRYLSWIGKLPGAEVGVFGPEDAARFRFDGGDGIIMPRRG